MRLAAALRLAALGVAAAAALGLALPASAGLVAARMPVVVYDGPAETALRRFLIGKGYPLVVIAETSEWLTVCLHDGSSGNVHRRDALPGDNVIVRESTVMRGDPNPGGTVKMRLGRNLLLTGTGDPISGWLPVRHENGIAGFVELASVWGSSGC